MRFFLVCIFWLMSIAVVAAQSGASDGYVVEVPRAYVTAGYIDRYENVTPNDYSCFGEVCYVHAADSAALQQLINDNIPISYEENFTYELNSNDTEFRYQSAFNNESIGWKNAKAIVDNATISDMPVIAIVDTGYTKHVDIDANIYACYSVSSDNCTDYKGHGNQVAGIAGAITDNNLGIASSSFGKVLLMPVKAFSEYADGFYSIDAIAALGLILQKKNEGVNIVLVNMSMGAYTYSDAMYTAISALKDAGVLVVASVGNDNTNVGTTPHYPSGYNLDNIIAVTALYSDLEFMASSNYSNSKVHIAAPGSYLLSLGTGNVDVVTNIATYDNAHGWDVSGTHPVYRATGRKATVKKTVYKTDVPYGDGEYSTVALHLIMAYGSANTCVSNLGIKSYSDYYRIQKTGSFKDDKTFLTPNPAHDSTEYQLYLSSNCIFTIAQYDYISFDIANNYESSTGTSMSSAFVAGVLGVAKAISPDTDMFTLRQMLFDTADNPKNPKLATVVGRAKK